MANQYDFTGKLTKSKDVQFFGANNTVTQTNTYDHLQRLKQIKHLVNTGTEVTLASMDYNELGQLRQKSLYGAVGSGIQNLNYSYNIRGWLEKINNPDVNPSATSLQKLNLGLYYSNVPSGLTASAQYNGNISAMVWNTPLQAGALSPADKQGYGFTYDGLNRLLTSSYGEGSTFATNAGANNENVTYDLNGNIKTLTRYRKGTGMIDNLTYTYKDSNLSNMLDKVDDAVSGVNGFSDLVKQANEYVFDPNGNLISDANKGYSSIVYNYLNLPKRIGTTSQYISYIYDALGGKMAKIRTGGDTVYYAGNFVYNGVSTKDTLSYIIHPEGMYLPGGNYQYYLKDHLGNIRLVVNISGTGGTIVQQTDYYPFGMDIANYNAGIGNKYRYNGKEFQDDVINGVSLQWYDYGARFYDPQIGRWHGIDPQAEKSYSVNPFAYCSGNPILFIDPDGRRQWPINETYKSYKRTHSNNWGEYRANPKPHFHAGDDMNFKGVGNGDKGAPIVSTHDGYVTSVKTIESGDKNAGGSRLTVTSEDGTVSTTYMHLSETDVKIGMQISEGQQIGAMGGTGFGKTDAYDSHLHYELKINGENVNPVGTDGKLIDPQKLITPAVEVSLPEVTIIAKGGSGTLPTPMPQQILVPEVKAPELMPTQQ